jgi:Fe-S-cluster containining protein
LAFFLLRFKVLWMAFCELCDGGCCRMYAVPLTHFDLLRIGRVLEEWAFCVDWLPVGSLDCTHPDVRLSGGYYYMVLGRGEGGACALSEDKGGILRCSVHGSHPLLCRTYPFSHAGRLLPQARCRGAVKPDGFDELMRLGRQELGEYRSQVESWNRLERPRRRPEDFIRFLSGIC